MPLIRLPDALRRYCDGAVSLEVDGATVGEALEELCRRHPAARLRLFDESGAIHAHLALFCNETQVRREDATGVALGRGDTVTLLEAVGGGTA